MPTVADNIFAATLIAAERNNGTFSVSEVHGIGGLLDSLDMGTRRATAKHLQSLERLGVLKRVGAKSDQRYRLVVSP